MLRTSSERSDATIPADESITEDFDFEFIDGTIDSSASELNEAFWNSLIEMEKVLKGAQAIEGCKEVAK